MKKPSTAALIPAAGYGTRLGLGPKALLCIEQRSLLDMLLTTVAETVDEIIVAAPSSHLDAVTELVAGRATVVVGGADRQESIDLLIAATQAEILLVHDAARPFATRRMFEDVITAAAQHGAAVTCVAPGVPVGIRQRACACLPSATGLQACRTGEGAAGPRRALLPVHSTDGPGVGPTA